MYYTDGSKQEDSTVGCVFLAVVEDQNIVESQFYLTVGAEVSAAEVQAIKKAITDVHQRGLGELHVDISAAGAL